MASPESLAPGGSCFAPACVRGYGLSSEPAMAAALARPTPAQRHPPDPDGQEQLGRCPATDDKVGRMGRLLRKLYGGAVRLPHSHAGLVPRYAGNDFYRQRTEDHPGLSSLLWLV